ncbi:MAG: DNA-binding transcriptional regulator [Gammaproteobacteria bacterium]|nr:DNA-binding transcriptional regulator [Gammaproteobacteria bacterium]
MSTQYKSSIMESVHETAKGLYAGGAINKATMSKYDLMCLKPVEAYDAQKIKSLRQRLELSQALLSSILNVSLSTVRQWEQGVKSPSGAAQKLISILDHKGLEALAY